MVLRHLTSPNKVEGDMWAPAFCALCVINPTLAIAVGGFAYWSSHRPHAFTVPDRDEALIQELREMADDAVVGDDDDWQEEPNHVFGNLFDEAEGEAIVALGARLNMPGRRAKWVLKGAALAKARFGLVDDTEANNIMLSDFIRKIMLEHGIRPSHVLQLYPLAVALALVPSEAEIMASRLRASAQRVNADYRHKGPWECSSKYRLSSRAQPQARHR